MFKYLVICIIILSVSCKQGMNKDTLQEELVQVLNQESKWVKVHAAEYLIWEGLNKSLVYDVYQQEQAIYQNESPYRIGVWRVLYQAAENQAEKDSYIQKIVRAYDDKLDTLHVIETLAKLKVPLSSYKDSFREEILESHKNDPFTIYGLWNLYADSSVSNELLFDRLYNVFADSSADEVSKIVTSYVFRYVPLTSDQIAALGELFSSIESETVQKQFLVTLLQRYPQVDEKYKSWRKQLIDLCKEHADQALIMTALNRVKDDFNTTQLEASYKILEEKTSDNYNADIHATAAYSLLKYMNL